MYPNLYIFFGLAMLLAIAPSTMGQETQTFTLDKNNRFNLTTVVNTEEKKINFEASVETPGWLGLGISPNGDMKGSDIFIGWVDDSGAGVNNDYYVIGRDPTPDTKTVSDWEVTSSMKTGSVTTIKFNRMFKTKDDNAGQDQEIKGGNIHLIWAYGELNPSVTDLARAFKQHSKDSRGSQSVKFFDPTNPTGPPSSAATALNSLLSLTFGSILVAFSHF